MMAAVALVWLAEAYALCGVLVAVAFALLGPGRALPDAGPVTPGARLLIVPGTGLLWPLVLRRWLGRGRPR